MKESIGNYVENALTIFGADVNKVRQLPLLQDGLKPAYRRLIYTALNSGDKYTKVAAIVGNTIATTHPHGDQSLLQPVSNMVRWGIFDGHGNHGAKTLIGQDIEKSAPRYIGAKIKDRYRKFFSDLMPYVPYVEAEMEGNVEPSYLPTPYPICLTHGTMGIGIGVNCRIPAFTLESLHEAYINDDPSLLKAPFGLKINYEKSDLDAIWRKGLGNICYEYNVYQDHTDAGFGTFIEGSAELFKPRMSVFDEWIGSGRAFVVDMSDKTGDRVFIGKNYNVRAVNHDMIYEAALSAASNTKTYRLTVADEDNVYLIPLKEWLKCTYENYISLIEVWKADKISKLEFDYQVYTWLPIITECLINHRDYNAEKLAEINQCDLDIVKAILRKSISTLQNTDSTAKLEDIKSNIAYYKQIDPVTHIDDIIKNF